MLTVLLFLIHILAAGLVIIISGALLYFLQIVNVSLANFFVDEPLSPAIVMIVSCSVILATKIQKKYPTI